VSTNLLLQELPRKERLRLEAFLEPVELEEEQVLLEPEKPIRSVIFIDNAVACTVQQMTNGDTIETGLIGLEGLAGFQLWLGAETTPTKVIVQVAGRARRMSAHHFKREVIKTASPLNRLIALYTHAFLSMTSITAACNRLHTVEERLCRWLKMTHSRVGRDEFYLRQKFIADMLGVHRPTVSHAAHHLQEAGLIKYSRGHMKILDPHGLAAGACECRQTIAAQMDKIFNRSWREAARDVR
jgi:CRP-like cAMP-binding protein